MFDQFTIESTATIGEALSRIKAGGPHRAVLVVATGRVVGVFSEGDAVTALLRGADIYAPIEPFVTWSFRFLTDVSPGTHEARYKALAMMRAHGISIVPIVDASFHLLGVVTLREILQLVVLP